MMQNASLKFENVFVERKNRLSNSKNFEQSLGKLLLSSRLMVGWNAAALAAGSYEKCLQYCLERKQFNKSIASF